MATVGNVRTEPLLGSIILMLVIGYLSQTSPTAGTAVLITLVAVAFGIQIAVAVLINSSEQVQGAKHSPRRRTVMTLASVVGVVAAALFAYASYRRI